MSGGSDAEQGKQRREAIHIGSYMQWRAEDSGRQRVRPKKWLLTLQRAQARLQTVVEGRTGGLLSTCLSQSPLGEELTQLGKLL